MADFTWNPDTYLEVMSEEIPDYRRLQDELLAAVVGADPRTILDLGVGSGLTARRVAEVLPQAHIHGIDESEEMLAGAAKVLDPERSSLTYGRLQNSLPAVPVDLVMSTLAVHHLDAEEKADLFTRIHEVLVNGGRFVLADLVVPPDPGDVVTPIDGVIDIPSTLTEQLEWLRDAGFTPHVHWHHRDLAVIAADKVG